MAVLTLSYHDFLNTAMAHTLKQVNTLTTDARIVIDFTNVYASGLSTQPKPCPLELVNQLLPNLKKVLAVQQQKNAIDTVEIWKADDSKGSILLLKAQVKACLAIVGSAMLAFFREPGWLGTIRCV